MRLQRTFDQLDAHLMAAPSPVDAGIVVGRQQTTDGQRYTFHHPTVGLLGELRLLLRYGGALHYEALCAGHPDDPMSTRRVELLDPTMKRLMARLDQPDLMPPVPAQGHIPVVTTARSYLDPGRLRTRDYHCTRCAAVVAQVVLADGLLEEAIRLVLGERPLPLLPIWSVELAASQGDEAVRICPVVQILPVRAAAVMLTAPAFERQIRRLQLAHCRSPKTPTR